MSREEPASFAAEVAALLRFQGELGLTGLDAPQAGPDWLSPRRPQQARASSAPTPPAAATAAPPAPTAPEGARVGSPPGRAADPAASLEAIRADLGDCTRCKLHRGRTHLVFGVGNPNARLMFVGEGPGRNEDLQGEPFVGDAGHLLDRMIQAMGLARRDVYIANIVKCRPPNNRDPEPDEVAACEPFLRRQIAAIGPEVLVALGRCAAQTLLRTGTPISRLRGRWHTYEGIPLMPTFHPAYLLRSPEAKRPAWQDLQQVMGKLGLEDPRKGGAGARRRPS